MSVKSIEVALVSASDRLIDFYREVFRLEVLEPRKFDNGIVHRLGTGVALVKIMVPHEAPSAGPPADQHFWEVAGMRYFTLWVDDLDSVVGRCEKMGGVIVAAPTETRPGIRMAVLRDPEGNRMEVVHE